MEKLLQVYTSPTMEQITLLPSSIILNGSPQPGGNEDVGYEDWGV